MTIKPFALEPGERVLGVIRPSLWTLFPRYAVAGVLVVFPFMFLFPLMGLGPLGMGIGAAAFLWGALRIWRTRTRWMHSGLYVTDRRLVDVFARGRKPFIEELAWQDVDEITMHRSIFGRMTGQGTLRVVGTFDAELTIEMRHVVNPKDVHDFLVEVQCHTTEAAFANAL